MPWMKSEREPKEIEVKLAVEDIGALRRGLHNLGAHAGESVTAHRGERVFEHNVLFDLPGQPIRKRGALLRLRWQAPAGKGVSPAKWKPATGTAFLTYKGRPSTGDGYKVADELETEIKDPQRLTAIFKAIGYRPSFVYEKFRTEFRIAGVSGLVVDVDETPMGNFVELEGPRKAIDRVAALLGRSRDEYLTGSYAALHREFCRRQGRSFGDMLFPRRKK